MILRLSAIVVSVFVLASVGCSSDPCTDSYAKLVKCYPEQAKATPKADFMKGCKMGGPEVNAMKACVKESSCDAHQACYNKAIKAATAAKK